MAEKPKRRRRSLRDRNLTKRGGVWYYQRTAGGRRVRISLETADKETARERRDAYEAEQGIGLPAPVYRAEPAVPTLADFAERYLAEDTAHLAATTRRDRPYYLAAEGPILRPLGGLRLDEITPAALREWWAAEFEAPRVGKGGRALKPRSASTGRHYVNTLAAVLAYAVDLGILEASPIPAFREQIRRRRRTKRGRAESEAGGRIRPLEDPAALGRLVTEARAEGPEAEAAVLLMLDAGLRLGEALGLTWGAIAWGSGPDDPARALRVAQSRPRGGEADDPKSGRARTVALSRRLRAALRALYRARFKPGPEALVLADLEPDYFRRNGWRRLCERAGVGARAMKDLRDTYASWLLSAGVQLGYVSRQLGHADVGVTARHYARWTGGEGYREPMVLAPGEVPADFLARLAPADSPQSNPTPRRKAAAAGRPESVRL